MALITSSSQFVDEGVQIPEQEGAEYRDDEVRGRPVRIGVKKHTIGFSTTYSAYVECPLCENPSTRKALGRQTPDIAITAVKKSLSGHMRTEHPQSLEMDSRSVAEELEGRFCNLTLAPATARDLV